MTVGLVRGSFDAEPAGGTATRRPTVAALEDLIGQPIGVLDHGFVRVVDYMGDDAAIVQAARVSYGRGTRHVSEDATLISYLMKHHHTTPFEMCEIKLHIKLPIFVARQWVRHRMASINEISARYSVLDREFYIPSQDYVAAQSQDNKQGRAGALSEPDAQRVTAILQDDAMRCYTDYLDLMNVDEQGRPRDPTRRGVARELARINLTLNTYTQWYWKIDLHNLLNFLQSRCAPNAQREIRDYADAIMTLVKAWVPLTHRAFENYRLGAVTLSAQMIEVLRGWVDEGRIDQASSGLSRRDWQDLLAAVRPMPGVRPTPDVCPKPAV